MQGSSIDKTNARSIVVVGDLVEGWPPHGLDASALTRLAEATLADARQAPIGGPPYPTADRETLRVLGGYLERLPLACVKAGLVDRAEIWHHSRSADVPADRHETRWLTRRVFRLDEDRPPFASTHMLRHIETFGAPHILVVLGLGVDERILRACDSSIRIYNSIDAPALRVPPEISRHFDLVLTGAEWQSDEVIARHPGMRCAVMPIGPEFADPQTFRPLGTPKSYDVVYVAAAQRYKRHDILFDALAAAPSRLRALCVFGYGEMGEQLRTEARERGLDVDFVGPPGVPFAEVNALMNEARIGVVCGVDDGAPAILTEYMLAGLPVLANERLSCGLQFITPETGRTAPADRFGDVLAEMLGGLDGFSPRQVAIDRWSWPKTVDRLTSCIDGLSQIAAPRYRAPAPASPIHSKDIRLPPATTDISQFPALRSTEGSHVSSQPIICFSHLRWDFVTQRPQHLMRRFARDRKVFFFEEHIPCDHPLPYLEFHPFPQDGVTALRPRLPHWWSAGQIEAGLEGLLAMLVDTVGATAPVLWFYTPMMFAFAAKTDAAAVVYDCMDELTGFRFADPRLVALETALIERADAVFTGGFSLYEAKRHRHANIHPFPSAVDAAHFGTARGGSLAAPADQAGLSGPVLGFYGVIDERLDLGLIGEIARLKPDWHFVMLGPIAKIDPADLPRAANLHWLGSKSYTELPAYLAGWDVALMPFAINEATRFISPTKTPEYLAGGRPVVSTGITDVVRHYGHLDGVGIAFDAAGFVKACETALGLGLEGPWLAAADTALAGISWDETQKRMDRIVSDAVIAARSAATHAANDETPASPAVHAKARRETFDTLVVGAGFAGAVLAERLAEGSGQRVLVIDRRDHIAGNAYDHHDDAGILVHRYGPHIFHTNSPKVVDYLSRFTAWRPYEHRVLASVGDRLLPIPINRTTLNGLYGLNLQTDADAAAFLAARAEPVADIRTSEDVVVAAVGRELYETFFRGYTLKQWGLDPSQLDRSVTARVPTRTNTDDRYFLDTFQAMPAEGYTAMFERMLDHPGITVRTGADYRSVRETIDVGHTVFTGPVDEFFDHRFGRLPYRCLAFRHETHEQPQFQPAAVVNFPAADVPFTRITEYKHLTGQSHGKTSISYEFPSDEGDPYYPVPREENQAIYRRYEALAKATPNVSFVGRLATYRYYNMDQVVAQALATYARMGSRQPMAGAGTISSVSTAGPST